jgi:uncharacterized iron-regulated membrane protein
MNNQMKRGDKIALVVAWALVVLCFFGFVLAFASQL